MQATQSRQLGCVFFILILKTHDFAEDELQNVELAEQEANKKRLELKSAKRVYTGYDDEEFAEGKHGTKRSVLAKYDEDIEGPSETVSVNILWTSIS